MPAAASNPPAEAADDAKAESYSLPCRVSKQTWQRIKYLSLKRSMAEGRNVTLSATAGDILDVAAEQLDDPPADMLSA